MKPMKSLNGFEVFDENARNQILDTNSKIDKLKTQLGGCSFSIVDGGLVISYDDGMEE